MTWKLIKSSDKKKKLGLESSSYISFTWYVTYKKKLGVFSHCSLLGLKSLFVSNFTYVGISSVDLMANRLASKLACTGWFKGRWISRTRPVDLIVPYGFYLFCKVLPYEGFKVADFMGKIVSGNKVPFWFSSLTMHGARAKVLGNGSWFYEGAMIPMVVYDGLSDLSLVSLIFD